MTKPVFTWRQKMVLRAASAVDYLPFRALRQTDFPHGVYRGLVHRGLMRPAPGGWEITEEGKKLTLWWTDHDRKNHNRRSDL